MVHTACATAVRPGELVWVVAILATGSPVKSPPGSTVGIESLRKRPQTLNRSLKVWSMRIISWVALKTLLSGVANEFVPAAPDGIWPKTSWMYAAETGLMFVIWEAVCVHV